MNLNLTWDLFILAFVGVVVAYSFIIGRNQTLKVISATYISILCSDALGNLFGRYFASSESFLKLLKLFSIGNAEQATAFFKVAVLIVLIVIIAVRGLYSFDVQDERTFGVKTGISGILGLLSASLMLSAIMIFISGNSLIADTMVLNNPLTEISGNSRLVRIMLDYSPIWFSIPGLAIVVTSLISKKS